MGSITTRLVAFAALGLALAGTGCAYQYRFVTGLPESGEEVTRWAHIGAWGWLTPEPFDLEQMCPDGVAQFGSHVSFANWAPAFLTLGLYSPRTVVARCAARAEAP